MVVPPPRKDGLRGKKRVLRIIGFAWLRILNFSLFFCLDAKEPKNQDLDLFAKKVVISLKDLNLRGYEVVSSIVDYCRASDTKSFLTLHFNFFLTQKSPKSI